ncbi:MAG: hypothetical protein GY798_35395 [Hyphomicrobiales bacterium]|nr:hypothetical protein [Hyphomicrobiales bacterium]
MRRLFWFGGGLVAALAIAFGALLVWAYQPVPTFDRYAYSPSRPEDGPTDRWQRSTREAQGMNSETLLEMVSFVQDEAASDPEFYLDSITIIRRGHIVAEIYQNPNFPAESNPYMTDNIRFVFVADAPYAELSYTARESWTPRFRIGLDGVPRVTTSGDTTYVATGAWTSDDTFKIAVEIIGHTTVDTWEFRFSDDDLFVTEHSITGDYSYQGRAMPDGDRKRKGKIEL